MESKKRYIIMAILFLLLFLVLGYYAVYNKYYEIASLVYEMSQDEQFMDDVFVEKNEVYEEDWVDYEGELPVAFMYPEDWVIFPGQQGKGLLLTDPNKAESLNSGDEGVMLGIRVFNDKEEFLKLKQEFHEDEESLDYGHFAYENIFVSRWGIDSKEILFADHPEYNTVITIFEDNIETEHIMYTFKIK